MLLLNLLLMICLATNTQAKFSHRHNVRATSRTSSTTSKKTTSLKSSTTVRFTSASAKVSSGGTSIPTPKKSSSSSLVSTSAKASPTPISVIDPALIVSTVQKRVENEYNLMGTAICIQGGYSTRCEPPWIYASSWEAFDSIDPRVGAYGWCTRDTTYLSNRVHDFWGWSSSNITNMLVKTGTYASAYAANTCLRDSKCKSNYKTSQAMFDSYFRHINNTFSANIVKALKSNPGQTFCPPRLGYGGLQFVSSYVQPSNERFGIHNTLYMPGMFDKITPSPMQTRSEIADIATLSAASLEAVFLYMVYGAQDASVYYRRRDEHVYSKEIYPGCLKQDFVLGGCKGIIPPREWDLNGRVLSMGERLRNSTLEPSNLEERACEAADSIQNYIDDLGALKTLKVATDAAIEGAGLAKNFALITEAEWGTAVAVSTPIGPAVFAATVVLGTAWYVLDSTVNLCEATGSCGYIPTFVINGVKAIDSITSLSDFTKAVTKSDLVGAAVGVVSDGTDLLLDDAQDFYKQAKQCCAVNCESTACRQASLFCMKSWQHMDCIN